VGEPVKEEGENFSGSLAVVHHCLALLLGLLLALGLSLCLTLLLVFDALANFLRELSKARWTEGL